MANNIWSLTLVGGGPVSRLLVAGVAAALLLTDPMSGSAGHVNPNHKRVPG